jgi:hypothetical protein
MAKKTLRNVGRMHRVNCDWCRLKMACSCFFDALIDKPSEGHPLVFVRDARSASSSTCNMDARKMPVVHKSEKGRFA